MKRQPQILITDAMGIHIPRNFAVNFGEEKNFSNWDEIKDDIETLKTENSHELEEYWEIWEDVCRNAKCIDANNKKSYLYQDGDLWLVPKNYKNKEKVFNWD